MRVTIKLKIFLFLILFILTKQIEIYAILMLFAIIHELGHLLAGVLLKLKPRKLTIMPFGFSIIFEESGSIKKANWKKLLIATAGPSINFGIAIILFLLNKNGTENLIYANLLIAIFNLLPIYPLDGGRILKSILQMKLEKRKTEQILHYITNITLIFLTALSSFIILLIKNIVLILVLAYLWSIVIKENKRYALKERVYDIIEDSCSHKYQY